MLARDFADGSWGLYCSFLGTLLGVFRDFTRPCEGLCSWFRGTLRRVSRDFLGIRPVVLWSWFSPVGGSRFRGLRYIIRNYFSKCPRFRSGRSAFDPHKHWAKRTKKFMKIFLSWGFARPVAGKRTIPTRASVCASRPCALMRVKFYY